MSEGRSIHNVDAERMPFSRRRPVLIALCLGGLLSVPVLIMPLAFLLRGASVRHVEAVGVSPAQANETLAYLDLRVPSGASSASVSVDYGHDPSVYLKFVAPREVIDEWVRRLPAEFEEFDSNSLGRFTSGPRWFVTPDADWHARPGSLKKWRHERSRGMAYVVVDEERGEVRVCQYFY